MGKFGWSKKCAGRWPLQLTGFYCTRFRVPRYKIKCVGAFRDIFSLVCTYRDSQSKNCRNNPTRERWGTQSSAKNKNVNLTVEEVKSFQNFEKSDTGLWTAPVQIWCQVLEHPIFPPQPNVHKRTMKASKHCHQQRRLILTSLVAIWFWSYSGKNTWSKCSASNHAGCCACQSVSERVTNQRVPGVLRTRTGHVLVSHLLYSLCTFILTPDTWYVSAHCAHRSWHQLVAWRIHYGRSGRPIKNKRRE